MYEFDALDSQKLIKILEKFGFRVVRQKGSHVIMMDEKNTCKQ